jgi:folate-binding protein YgfZ
MSALPLPPAVVCDLAPTVVVTITGPDAAAFLQGQLSNDAVALPEGAAQYTSYNSPKGRMLANFPLWRLHGDFFALLPGDLAAAVIKRLRMFVLRSKVKVEDLAAGTARFGVGGADAPAALAGALDLPAAPPPFTATVAADATVVALPGPRYLVVAAGGRRDALTAALGARAAPAAFDTWRWLTIRAGVPVITAATQDLFVAQTANWDALGGISFGKGCYTGQEIIARTQYLGRLKERLFLFHAAGTAVAAGTRVFSAVFGDQPCGTVVDAAGAPGGGADLLAVLQLAAAESGDVRLGAPDGTPLEPLPLPYALPAPAAPRGRVGA